MTPPTAPGTSRAEYFWGDALGSVRQLTDPNGNLTLSKAYDPYGTVAQSAGAGQSGYGYTNEYQDSYNDLVYLRARHYAPSMGRFLTRDTWAGNYNRPGSLNRWGYVEGNPINAVDPSGYITQKESKSAALLLDKFHMFYGITIVKDWGYKLVPASSNSPYIVTGLLMECEWEPGSWRNLEELRITFDAVRDLSKALGGRSKLKGAVGNVYISRHSKVFPWDNPAFSPPGKLSAVGDIVIQDYLFDYGSQYAQFTVVHEFGHVWDYRAGNQLSMNLIHELGGWRCETDPFHGNFCFWDFQHSSEIPPDMPLKCGNTNFQQEKECIPYSFYNTGAGEGTENWAQSLAYYVYPSYDNTTSGLRQIRRRYVKKQIADLP